MFHLKKKKKKEEKFIASHSTYDIILKHALCVRDNIDCAPRLAYFTKSPFLYLLTDNRKCLDSKTTTYDTSLTIDMEMKGKKTNNQIFILLTISMLEWNAKLRPG